LAAEVTGGLAGGHGDYFNLEDLRSGVLIRYGRRASEKDLDRAARENCSNNPFESLGLPSWLWIIFVAGLLLSAVLIAVSLRRARAAARRRRLAQPTA
jgi:hypothetical protein